MGLVICVLFLCVFSPLAGLSDVKNYIFTDSVFIHRVKPSLYVCDKTRSLENLANTMSLLNSFIITFHWPSLQLCTYKLFYYISIQPITHVGPSMGHASLLMNVATNDLWPEEVLSARACLYTWHVMQRLHYHKSKVDALLLSELLCRFSYKLSILSVDSSYSSASILVFGEQSDATLDFSWKIAGNHIGLT